MCVCPSIFRRLFKKILQQIKVYPKSSFHIENAKWEIKNNCERQTFIYLVRHYNHCDLDHGLYLNENKTSGIEV